MGNKATKHKTEGWEDRVRNAAESNINMAQAAKSLNMDPNYFKKLAKELGVYQPHKNATKNYAYISIEWKDRIISIMDKNKGNISKSCKDLCIGENTLRRMLKELDLLQYYKEKFPRKSSEDFYTPNKLNISFKNTKQLGNIGEAKALAEFLKFGIPVYLPFGDNEKADMIVEINNKLYRIQVKTSEKVKDGNLILFSIDARLTPKHGKSNSKFYTKDNIDYFVLYNLETDLLFLVDINDISSKYTFSVRLNKAKNDQQKLIHYFKDYLFEDVVKKIMGN